MKILMNYVNDATSSLISGYKSPQSIARAYKQYLEDKLVITSKMLSALFEAVSDEVFQNDDVSLLTVGNTDQRVSDILDNAGLTFDTPMITIEGDTVKLGDAISSILNTGNINTPLLTGVFGKEVNILDNIDSLVDSFQVGKVAESAFALVETFNEQTRASMSDIMSRMTSLGMTMTSNASNMMVTIGDMMADGTTSILGKISSITGLLSLGSEKIYETDEDGIVIPDFSTEDMQGTSPMMAVLQSINIPNIDWNAPIDAIVGAVKVVGGVFSRVFQSGKNLAVKGYNIAKNYIEETFVDPKDFVINDKNSPSHIVDIPFFDHEVKAGNLYGNSWNSSTPSLIWELKVGQMRTLYTPYALFNFIRTQGGIRVIGHIIPSKPFFTNDFTLTDSMLKNPVYKRAEPNTVPQYMWNYAHDRLEATSQNKFEHLISEDISNSFKYNEADEDAYFLHSIATSMFRVGALVELLSLNNYHRKSNRIFAGVPSSQPEEVNPKLYEFTPNELVDATKYFNGASVNPNFKGYLAKHDAEAMGHDIINEDGSYSKNATFPWSDGLGQDEYDDFIVQLMEGNFYGEQITNKDFVYVLEGYKRLSTKRKNIIFQRLFTVARMNDFSFMDDYFSTSGEVPAFIPTVSESEYQTPMYSIVSDSIHGGKITKLFKGIAIVATVVIVGVVAVKTAVSVKRSMASRRFTLAGRQRLLENMDPSSPEYEASMKSFRKDQRQFNRQNKFLSYIGMGAKNTATSSLGELGISDFIPSNDDVISLLK